MGTQAIWIVDDDDSVRESLRGLLEAYDYVVTDFPGSSEFLAADGVDGCDCLLLDLNLPQVSGLDVLERLRVDAAAAIPVVVITGQGGLATRRRALAAGADAYLEKPFDGEELLRTVGALTARSARPT
jgi:FixJ family two-component response regulator